MSEQGCFLQESATLRQAAVPILRELANNASVYLMTHVIDDVGEATVRGALEDAGLIGLDAGQIKPHRVLFCSTLEGKVSIVPPNNGEPFSCQHVPHDALDPDRCRVH